MTASQCLGGTAFKQFRHRLQNESTYIVYKEATVNVPSAVFMEKISSKQTTYLLLGQ